MLKSLIWHSLCWNETSSSHSTSLLHVVTYHHLEKIYIMKKNLRNQICFWVLKSHIRVNNMTHYVFKQDIIIHNTSLLRVVTYHHLKTTYLHKKKKNKLQNQICFWFSQIEYITDVVLKYTQKPDIRRAYHWFSDRMP